MSAIIQIQSLRKVYTRRKAEDVVAVHGLDLELGHHGTVHGYLGPNGSGKTTTIRCLLGLITPTSGGVKVFGVDANTHFHEVASRVGAIVENPKLFPNFSGGRNLSLLADLAGLPSSRVDEVLGIVGLADRAGDSFDSYSLGMKQRLAIAAALLKDPELLILDEPANGLDPAGIAEMRVLIRDIASQGKAVIVSSHQLSEIEQVCDDVTIISHGRLIETGTLAHVQSFAGEDEVVVSIAQRDQAVRVLQQAGLSAHPRLEATELVVAVEAPRMSEVNRVLADAGLYLDGLRIDRVTLEQAFLNLTGGPPPPTLAAPTPVGAAQPAPAAPPMAPPTAGGQS